MKGKAQVEAISKAPAGVKRMEIPEHPGGVRDHEEERPAIGAQLEGAARLGHSLDAIAIGAPVQRQLEEEEEEFQAQPAGGVQRQTEEEEQLEEKPLIQRQELPDEDKELQTKPANGVQRQGGGEGFQLDDETARRINRARGGGQPLEGALQEQMSASLGHDFSRVRVHTDSEADALNQQLSAKAFTTGPDIFFRRGEYNPCSGSGRKLIAHELSHVVQQTSERVSGRGGDWRVAPAGDALEQEAEDEAARAVAGHVVGARVAADWKGGARPGAAHAADRQAAGEGSGRREGDTATLPRPRVSGAARARGQFMAPLAARPAGRSRPTGVLQRREWDPVRGLAEGESITLAAGPIKYTGLAAGCMAVTATFSDGGVSGIHLAMGRDNLEQWGRFDQAVGGHRIAALWVDFEPLDDGWRVRMDEEGEVDPTEKPRAVLDLGVSPIDAMSAGWYYMGMREAEQFFTRGYNPGFLAVGQDNHPWHNLAG